ncbi:hypothetical protein [Runella sp.]|uniref:hypothetical protein n=1 Tax=Runella sp. TaxID=1960881 RepID=UPI0030165564
MTLQERLSGLITAIGTDIKALFTRAIPAGGTTGQALRKSSGSDYATEWYTPSVGVQIDDAAASGTKTYSSNKIESVATAAANNAKNEILNGAGAAYDTLSELQALLQGQDSSVTALTTAINNRVRYDAAQTLSTVQITQACANIGLGEPDTNLASLYTTAKA